MDEQQEIKTNLIRCTTCRAEFKEEEITDDVKACPRCGTTSIPQNTRYDVTLTLNWHDLRILCMWADNWARQTITEEQKKNGHQPLAGILSVIRKHRPLDCAPLTLIEELDELASSPLFNGDIQFIQGDEITTIKKKNLN